MISRLAISLVAVAAVVGCARKSPPPITKIDQAQVLLFEEKYVEAIKICDELLAANSNDHRAYLVRGEVHAKDNNLLAALEDFTRAIELSPNDPDGYDFRAEIHQRIADQHRAKAKEYATKDLIELENAERILVGKHFDAQMADESKSRSVDPTHSIAYTNDFGPSAPESLLSPVPDNDALMKQIENKDGVAIEGVQPVKPVTKVTKVTQGETEVANNQTQSDEPSTGELATPLENPRQLNVEIEALDIGDVADLPEIPVPQMPDDGDDTNERTPLDQPPPPKILSGIPQGLVSPITRPLPQRQITTGIRSGEAAATGMLDAPRGKFYLQDQHAQDLTIGGGPVIPRTATTGITSAGVGNLAGGGTSQNLRRSSRLRSRPPVGMTGYGGTPLPFGPRILSPDDVQRQASTPKLRNWGTAPTTTTLGGPTTGRPAGFLTTSPPATGPGSLPSPLPSWTPDLSDPNFSPYAPTTGFGSLNQ